MNLKNCPTPKWWIIYKNAKRRMKLWMRMSSKDHLICGARGKSKGSREEWDKRKCKFRLMCDARGEARVKQI